MDLVTNFIFLIVFGLVSFGIEKIGKWIWGVSVNPYHIYTAVGLVTFIGSIIYIMWPLMTNVADITVLDTFLGRFVTWLVNFLPGAIIGDIAGTYLAELTGDRRYR